jgi:diguanylate cyclase (GGDEF)-like protein
MALAFEEGVRRAARLQLRMSADLKRDMTSVWAVAAAVALPPFSAVILLTSVLSYVWFRQHRPAGESLPRKLFNASTVLLGSLFSGVVVREFGRLWVSWPWQLGGAAAVLVAILAYTLVNRTLVSIGLLTLHVRSRALLGSREDNLIEAATLCLGGLVAIAVLHEPWLCILVLAPMITLQRGALVRELETAAMVDAKTGLFNAVAWEQVAKHELARALRETKPAAILIIDIDRFKLVNDRCGHLAGDAVLKAVGKCLSTGVREYDTVGRFGGEEFVVVLPGAGDLTALTIAERLRAHVNALRLSAIAGCDDVGEDPLSVSIGVACAPIDGDDVPSVLLAADGALYAAKDSGRNRVALADRGLGRGLGAPAPVTS